MQRAIIKTCLVFILLLLLFGSVACLGNPDTPEPPKVTEKENIPSKAPTPSTVPPRLLTVCMGQEPASLFLYGDGSTAARSVRQAIYDGPYDILNFELSPVIMEQAPTMAGGDVSFEPVAVQLGENIVDNDGDLTGLAEGVLYHPVGCREPTCALTYTGQDAVQMDQLVVKFRLRPGVQWSDGNPVTADDSVFSFEIARDLYPQARAALIAHTTSYQAFDESAVEWRGLPGYVDSGYGTFYFTPLPRHSWGSLPAEELLAADMSSLMPLGWGAYIIEEWTAGDHITLKRNPNYFRNGEGLPDFDTLVFRFIPSREEALSALLAGECDLLDETIGLEALSDQLHELEEQGSLSLFTRASAAWEHIDFGITPVDLSIQPAIFGNKETRQAIAMCVDRVRIAEELFHDQAMVLNSYVSPDHPRFYPDAKKYTFDPQAANELFDLIGWLDSDGDLNTPRQSLGVPGVPDSALLSFTFLTTDEQEKQLVASIIKDSLTQCGVQMEIATMPWDSLFAPGPEGPIFGRKFTLAQFGWVTALEPPCFLYLSREIPGPYPEYPRGWGGANASGYRNPDYDRACQGAMASLPESPEHQAAHNQAQGLFAEDVPALPLYLRPKLMAARPDMCGIIQDHSIESNLWNIESYNYGEDCTK